MKPKAPRSAASSTRNDERAVEQDTREERRLGFDARKIDVVSSDELPHRPTIQRSFGPEHDVSRLRVRVGGSAASETHAVGAPALTRGDEIAFAKPPHLRLAAHEAAHAIQQRRGGAPRGQEAAYERHADAVAEEVVAGRPAGHLFAKLPVNGSVVQTQLASLDAQNATTRGALIPDEPVRAPNDALKAAQNTIYDWYSKYLGATRPDNLTDNQRSRLSFEGDSDFERNHPDGPRQAQKADAYTERATSKIRVRSRLQGNNKLTRLLVHELLHSVTSPYWQAPKQLDEAATQLLALSAYYETPNVTKGLIDNAGPYAPVTNLLNLILEKSVGAERIDMLARAYFTGDDSDLRRKIVQALNTGSSIGFGLFFVGFLPYWVPSFDGNSIPAREPKINGESPLKTIEGLFLGNRKVTRVNGSLLVVDATAPSGPVGR